MSRNALLLIAPLLLIPAALSAQGGNDAATAFGAREEVLSIAIAPDGNRIAYVEAMGARGARIVTVDLANPAPRAISSADGAEQRLTGCSFASNDRLVCRLYSIMSLSQGLAPVSRLLAVDVDGARVAALGERNSINQLYFRSYSGGIIDFHGGTESSVLMEQQFVPEQSVGTILGRRAEGLGVVRLDTRTLRSTTVEPPRRNAEAFISDGRGRVRIIGVREYAGTGQASSRTVYQYRRAGQDEWEAFGTFDEATNEGILPMAVDPDLDVAYAFAKLNGRLAVYRVSLDGSLRRDLVAANDTVDVDGLIRIGRRQRVVGVSFAMERRQSIYFDPELQAIAQRLHRALPSQPIVDYVDATEDESKLLIMVGSDNDPGRYFLYDRASRTLASILPARPQLEGVTLATVRPVTYAATDGTRIPGYLTLPPGSSGRGLPAIVMPHGGPGARDEWGFDWLAQYFANRGFAVLQPNFRGSTGYGDAWFQQNGFRSWRTAVGDVNDAGRWLVSEGIADPAKLAIFGWSYGGYAALQSNVLDSSLFKAVVAVAPVTDLDVARNAYVDSSRNAVVRDFFGSGPHIVEGSPARNTAAIRAPVLLFHGDRDINVDIQQSRLMETRLRGAGRPGELIVYPGLDHQLDDSAARADMLRRSDAFLRRVLGLGAGPPLTAAPPPPPAPAAATR
jgi:dipeptidyl aminopeptidase/acylaminoacyl peptidase